MHRMMVIYIQIYEPKALRVSQLLKKSVELNGDNSFIHLFIQHTLDVFYMQVTVIGIGNTD